ncbi:MAG: FAD:protein FMN transferase [Spirochaetales bacterium]|nr:FAD:protein FMN transferase [Spirochaetales bacterium]
MKILSYFGAGILGIALVGCSPQPSQPLSGTTLEWLGTTSTLTLYDQKDEGTINEAFGRVGEIHHLMSLQLPTSEISEINQAAGKHPVQVSPETYKVIKDGLNIAAASNGAFDPTIGPIVSLWDITGEAYLPTPEEIDALLPLVDYRLVQLSDENRSVFLPIEGMKIDLGAIAKGYAADEAAQVLKARGVTKAIVDFGGNIIVLGTRDTGEPWRVGIQNPFLKRGEYLGIMYAQDQTVVTSGTYERFMTVGGVKYHHLFDPANGYPANNGLESVSVIAQGPSTLADAYSTAAFILGPEKGRVFVESIPGLEALFVTSDGQLLRTSGLPAEDETKFRIIDENFR